MIQNEQSQIEEPEINEETQEIQKQIQEMIETPVLQEAVPQAAVLDVSFLFNLNIR